MSAKFYDGDYWHEGTGALLWGYRKMLTFINAVSGENTRAPFLVPLNKHDEDDTPNDWVGWNASWISGNNDYFLEIEVQGDYFAVWCMDASAKVEGRPARPEFSYEFGKDTEGDYGWDGFLNAAEDARQWLTMNATVLSLDRDTRLLKEFNLM